ncbi:MAG: 4Fe-4S dicluster domain-containing protein [Candidatus Krumholzibacteriia bacterium]
MDRRDFLTTMGAAGACLAGAGQARASGAGSTPGDGLGVLVDTTLCIGCRKCEWACNENSGLSRASLAAFEDQTVYASLRRPTPTSYTVVNRFGNQDDPVYVKAQCMHCLDPACSSACIVTAFARRDDGVVAYDPWRCMGCRYCMVACPFGVPAYEYDNASAPQVRKCTFCLERLDQGERPACVAMCPVECLTFGKRSSLLDLAHRKIARHPGRYVDHVYGEHEVGGTSWLYLSSTPFEQLGLPTLGNRPIPTVTETIQHSVFKNFVPPVAVAAFLGQIMWLTHRRDEVAAVEGGAERGRADAAEEPSRRDRSEPERKEP